MPQSQPKHSQAIATPSSPDWATKNGDRPPTRRPRLPRGWPYWLAGLGLAGLVALALRPSAVPVDLGEVERGTLWVTVAAEGQTRVRDRFVVAAPVAGRLARIDLEPGDTVASGEVVAQIDSLPLDSEVRAAQARLRELEAQRAGVETQRPKAAALAQAQANIDAAIARQRQAAADVEEATANLAQARRDRDRARTLAAAGAQSRQALEAAALAVTQQEQAVQAARQRVEAEAANVAAARNALTVLQREQDDPDYLVDVYDAQIAGVRAELLNLADEARRTTVEAPAAGRVLRVLQESARFVQAGEPLLEIGNANQLELVIDILSTDAVQVEPGDLIEIDHWGGESQLQARVRYVEPAAFTEISALGVEEQRVNVIADFVDPPTSLGDGYRVEAEIVVWAGDAVVKVPQSALFRCDEQTWCTFVVEQGRVQSRPVVIGERNDWEAVVEQGLSLGESVVLHPSEAIESGQRVRDRQ
ncbi:MAG: efflux RND transporter periplasmic adaptor subunit [Spirulinaceae cyanobacterium SM2_1_0]|nr:efflux RND transporter periplasmic adaptor subunit [Spirulinaceae cyanobacterium SM2_1_0]